jgi:hypothetical protein
MSALFGGLIILIVAKPNLEGDNFSVWGGFKPLFDCLGRCSWFLRVCGRWLVLGDSHCAGIILSFWVGEGGWFWMCPNVEDAETMVSDMPE